MVNVRLSEEEVLQFRLQQQRARAEEAKKPTTAQAASQTSSKQIPPDIVEIESPEEGLKRKKRKSSTQTAPSGPAARPAIMATPSPSRPPTGASSSTSWHQTLKFFEGSAEDADSLWDTRLNHSAFISEHLFLSGDEEKFNSLDLQSGFEAIMAQSLQIASLSNFLSQKTSTFDEVKHKLSHDLELAKRRGNKYAEANEGLKQQLLVANEKYNADMKTKEDRIAELEKSMATLALEKEKAETSLIGVTNDLKEARLQISAADAKLKDTIFSLKSDCVNQFEAGFEKAMKQVTHYHPALDTSTFGAFKVFRNGELVDYTDQANQEEEKGEDERTEGEVE